MTEGAVQLQTLRDRNGRTWVSADSLTDMFEQMSSDLQDGPGKKTLQTLANTFRSFSSYADLEAEMASDGSRIQARRCVCGTAVVDGRNIGGETIVINAEPDDAGELFPLRIREGVPTLAPWRPGLEGVSDVRLARHQCSGVTP